MALDLIETLIMTDHLEEGLEQLTKESRKFSQGLIINAMTLRARHNSYKADKAGGTNNNPQEKTQITQAAFHLINELKSYSLNGELLAESLDHLLNGNRYPFVDRIEFRKMLRDQIHTEGAKIIFVRGPSKSGMSYLENYLIHLSSINPLYSLVRINAAAELDDPDPYKGVILAKLLAIELNLNLSLDADEKDQFKFSKFTTKLKEKFLLEGKIPIVFIHDFHKLEVMPDINRFIAKLADAFRQGFPRAVFIIAGIECTELPNWYADMNINCHVYNIESINVDHIRECLGKIFDCFRAKIIQLGRGNISKGEYVDGMITRLIPNEANINLAVVGRAISDHLIQIQKA